LDRDGTLPERNDPCHCGSGKKYKKCHLPREEAFKLAEARGRNREIPPQILQKFRAMQQADEEYIAKYGHSRPTVHGDFQGHKFVAVGGTIHYSDKWRNFTDFLLYFIKRFLGDAFGPDWYTRERVKPQEARHPIVRWYEAFCDLGARTERNNVGLLEAEPDGPTRAYLNLAYDLYVVGDNARLQKELVRRLRDASNFQGARYELAVAALMVRAGFTIDFEDEADNSRRHAEFVATHRETGARVAVEAKARRRSGVMGWVGPRQDPEDIRLSIDELFRDACDKDPDLPLVIFIDANMPPEMATGQLERWTRELQDTLPRVGHGFSDTGVFEGVPFALLVVTNTPHDYARPGESAADGIGYSSQPVPAKRPLPNGLIRPAVEKALQQYGNFPQDFPLDPREVD
jgi:hypothetical protein